jgi:hypothetical protein
MDIDVVSSVLMLILKYFLFKNILKYFLFNIDATAFPNQNQKHHSDIPFVLHTI